MVRTNVSRFTLSRTSSQPPRTTLQAVFFVSPVRRLEYHNVLYDTPATPAVKSPLAQLEGIAKTELSTAISRVHAVPSIECCCGPTPAAMPTSV